MTLKTKQKFNLVQLMIFKKMNMKKKWVFTWGIVTGIVVTFLVLFIIAKTNKEKNVRFFDKPGEVIEYSSVKVFQALGDGFALANCEGVNTEEILNMSTSGTHVVRTNFIFETTVLLYNEEGTPYYDDQIVKASKDQCFKQVGIYHYPTKNGDRKTVPIVMLMEK